MREAALCPGSGYRIWLPDREIGSGIFFEIRPGPDPARLPHRQSPSMHPHPPTLTHLHMSTRLTLIHPDCHLLGKKRIPNVSIDLVEKKPAQEQRFFIKKETLVLE